MRYNYWLLVPPDSSMSWCMSCAGRCRRPWPCSPGRAGWCSSPSVSSRQTGTPAIIQSYPAPLNLLLPSQLEGLSEFTLQTDAHLPSQSYLNIAETIVHSSYLVSGMDQQLPASTELCRSCCIFLVHFYPSSWVSDWPGHWLIGAGGEDGISRSHLTRSLLISPELQAYDGDELGEGGVVMSW